MWGQGDTTNVVWPLPAVVCLRGWWFGTGQLTYVLRQEITTDVMKSLRAICGVMRPFGSTHGWGACVVVRSTPLPCVRTRDHSLRLLPTLTTALGLNFLSGRFRGSLF